MSYPERMPTGYSGPYTFFIDTASPEIARAVEDALRGATIPYHSGIQSVPEPRVVFSVPRERLEEARRVVGQFFGTGPLVVEEEGDLEVRRDLREEQEEERERRFPRGPIAACLAVVIFHLAFVWTVVGESPTPGRLAASGGLVSGGGIREPWRLVTSLFVHSSIQHALGNGISLMAFAVPLVLALGYARASMIYLVSGVAGGLAALFTCPQCVTVGSSGAVAGLFGAWLVRALRKSRRAPPAARARIKVIGIGLLVLPTLLSPATATGGRISVASHLGGALAGVCLGLLFLWKAPEATGSETLVD